MYTFIRGWLELKVDRRAVTALEYGLIAAAVVAVGLVGMNAIGNSDAVKFTGVKAAMT
jgi:Flp pilus assembly pilin Flp